VLLNVLQLENVLHMYCVFVNNLSLCRMLNFINDFYLLYKCYVMLFGFEIMLLICIGSFDV
jgi:hypothetical protein